MIVKPYGTGENGLMIIGESPSSVGSAVTGEPFTGKAGVKFFNALKQLGILKSECYVDNVINWHPSNLEADNFYGMISSRIKKIREKVLEIKPMTIVCLGKFASDTFSRKIWKRNKKPCLVKVKWKGMKFNLVVTYHPSAVYNYKSMPEKEYIDSLMKLMMK